MLVFLSRHVLCEWLVPRYANFFVDPTHGNMHLLHSPFRLLRARARVCIQHLKQLEVNLHQGYPKVAQRIEEATSNSFEHHQC